MKRSHTTGTPGTKYSIVILFTSWRASEFIHLGEWRSKKGSGEWQRGSICQAFL